MISQDLVPYVLRHAFATDMLRAGATSALVSELLGHASWTTTWTYTNTDQARIVELLHSDHRAG